MGDDGTHRALERVSNLLAGLRGSTRCVRRDSERGSKGTNGGTNDAEQPPDARRGSPEDVPRPLTDGGADEAPSNGGPWIEDDPIVFEDEASDHGTALLEAVTDDSSEADDAELSPFGGGDTVPGEGTQPPESGAGGVDPDRLEELEARIEALESDHVHMEAGIDDVASGLADLRDDVGSIGSDVRQLVALLGGIALATDGVPTETEPALAEHPAEEPPQRPAANSPQSQVEPSSGDPPERSVENQAVPDPDRPPAPADDAGAGTGDAEPRTGGDEPGVTDAEATAAETDPGDASSGDDDRDDDPMPEGIHRGVGDAPRSSADAETDPAASARGERSGGSARELVDPRTDAVGARLRQFREGFADDPTADLPTGGSADEFRFEKVLLPTDGEAAPDLSAGELEKPYLESLPDGYAVDAVVLEWLDWLVSAADGATAAEAIVYYESIEWLTGDVREDLLGYLDGLGERAGAEPDGERPAALDLQDHLRSLQYVTELASGEVGRDGV